MTKPLLRDILPYALIILVVFLVFGRSLSHDFVYWDDDVHITANPSVASPALRSTLAFWKKPHDLALTRTLWAGLARVNILVGRNPLDPRIYYFSNIAVHGLSSSAVFFILLLLTGSAPASLLGALLFGLHPLQAESVAWASGLKELLSGFFTLISIAFFLQSDKESAKKRILLYGGAFICFLLSLTAKTTSAGLPLVLLLLLPQRKMSLREVMLKLAPFFMLSLAALLLSRSLQPETKVVFVPSFLQRLVLFCDSFFFYINKLILPFRLIPHYDRLPQVVIASPHLAVRAGLGGLLIAASFLLFVMKKTREQARPLPAFFFFLLPVLGLIPFIYQSFSLTADRYAYLALLGPAWMISAVFSLSGRKNLRFALFLPVLLWGIFSFVQTGYWKDSSILFTRTAEVNPQSWVAYNNLGVAVSRKNPAAGAAFFRKALASRPEINPDLATSHYNLGLNLARAGDYGGAEEHWKTALELKPGMVRAWNNLGILYEKQGRMDEAFACFLRSLEKEPADAQIRFRAENLSRRLN